MNRNTIFLIGIFLLVSISKLHAQDPEGFPSSTTQILNGYEYFQKEEYLNAIDEYQKVNRNDSNYVTALAEIALCYYQNKDYSKAYEICQKGLALKSDQEPYFYNIAGISMEKLGNYDEAEKIYKTGLDKFPYDYKIHYNYGLLYERKGKMDMAIQKYQTALTYNPFHSSSHYRLGRIYAINEKPAHALMAMEMYLITDPDNSSAYSVLGNLEEAVNNMLPPATDSQKVTIANDNFAELEELIKAKVALNKSYKNKTKLDYVLARQTQLFLEKLTYDPNDKEFFMQFYVPFYSKVVKNKYLEPLVYLLYASAQNPDVKSIVNRNMSKIKVFYAWAINEWKNERKYRSFPGEDPTKKLLHYFYDNNNLNAIGATTDSLETNRQGDWTFYHKNGFISDKSFYDNSGKATGKWESYYEDGTIKEISNFSDGLRNGEIIIFYPNGMKELEYKEVNDKVEGELRVYYPSGQLKKTIPYSDNLKSGPFKVYYNSGGIKEEGTYTTNKLNGLYKQYYETGELLEEASLINDYYDGPVKNYFRNGKIKSEANYKDGKISGEFKEFFENGILRKVSDYDEKGIVKGTWKLYYEDGKTVKHEVVLDEKDKTKSYDKEYFESGALWNTFTLKEGKVKEYRYQDEKGNILSQGKEAKGVLKLEGKRSDGTLTVVGQYTKGLLNGAWMYYDRNGILKSISNYKNGILEGTSTEYYPNGNVHLSYTYKNDQLHGLYESYFKNKNLAETGWYVEDKKEGEWKDFFPTGKIDSKVFYVKDEPVGIREFYNADSTLYSEEEFKEDVFVKSSFYDSMGKMYSQVLLPNGSGIYAPVYMNGTVRVKGEYKNGLAEGNFVWNYTNGKLLEKGSYLHHKQNGPFVRYHENGSKQSEGQYDFGDATGSWHWYFENGKTSQTGHYTNGHYDSVWTYYYENGKIEIEAVYNKGVKEGPTTYYSNTGDIQYVKNFKNGKLISYTYLGKDGQFVPEIPVVNETVKLVAYYSNGQKSVEENIVHGWYEGKRLFYYPNGQLERDVNFTAFEQEGESVSYYSNGKVKSKEMYYYDQLHGPVHYYAENGSLQMEGNYLLGMKHGDWKFYDNNGKLQKTVQYLYNQPYAEKK